MNTNKYKYRDGLPNFFLAGCQKTASTWLHRCFLEHPDIFVPQQDAIHFFTINYQKGIDWYCQYYVDYKGENMVGDTTPSYFRDYLVPRRISSYNPDSKIILSLRNPIDRAFSHYWHEKKKRKIAFEFREVFENYDLFQNWVVPGFYFQHLERFFTYFHREQCLVLIYEDLLDNSCLFVREVFRFLGVDEAFVPSVVDRKINEAWYKPVRLEKVKQQLYWICSSVFSRLPTMAQKPLKRWLQKRTERLKVVSEYERGIEENIRRKLRELFRDDIERLMHLIKRDLNFWQ